MCACLLVIYLFTYLFVYFVDLSMLFCVVFLLLSLLSLSSFCVDLFMFLNLVRYFDFFSLS